MGGCQETNNQKMIETKIGYFFGLEEKDNEKGCEDKSKLVSAE